MTSDECSVVEEPNEVSGHGVGFTYVPGTIDSVSVKYTMHDGTYPIWLGFSNTVPPATFKRRYARAVCDQHVSTERAARWRRARTVRAGPLSAYWIPTMGIACTMKLVPYSETVTSTVAFTLL